MTQLLTFFQCTYDHFSTEPIPELSPEELLEPEPLVNTPAGGFRRPGKHKDSPRKGQATAKGNKFLLTIISTTIISLILNLYSL